MQEALTALEAAENFLVGFAQGHQQAPHQPPQHGGPDYNIY